ncbi:MAG: hypothetical protein IKS55_08605 [Oscillospiraceae bacterium]|nr:hypothetical protein [Oscillospiraceae bacterium]
MKRVLAFWLALILLAAPAVSSRAESGKTASAEAETTEEKETVPEDLVRDQSFSLAMAAWLGGYPDYVDEDLLRLDAAGWYAALQARYGYDLISEEDITDFLHSVGYSGDPRFPESWEDYGILNVLSSKDGRRYYSFGSHRNQLDELLGVTMEVRLETTAGGSALATIVYHYEDGSTAEWSYELSYVKNEDPSSAFPYRLAELKACPFVPQIEGNVDFDWKDLQYANRLDTVLMFCPAVHIESDVGGYTDRWLFRTEERMVDISQNGTLSYGQVNGIDFRRDGAGSRVLVGKIDPPDVAEETFNQALSYVFSDLVRLELVRKGEENYILNCKTRSGTRVIMTVNRLTLWIQQLDGIAEDGSLLYRYTFRYDQQPPRFSLLEAWDGPLRTVTLDWEDFRTGTAVRWTDFVRVPADWEVLPYEGRWGEYTIYLDYGYTSPYQYPGDGADYTLYLSTAKG